ncbi:MAG: hypothetical protein HYW78_03315, partial [Parcubacteria group bacterium]|nr:hypothetical protein [Parcubacteria group bacterium]
RESINGEEITLYAEIKNAQKIEIKNASIEFRFSDGFTFSTSTIPCAIFERGCAISINAIAPRDSLRIGLTGRALSRKQITISGNLEFSIKDISSLFKKYTSHEINLIPSLTIEIESPRNVFAYTPLAISALIKNTTQKTFEFLIASLEFPENFIREDTRSSVTLIKKITSLQGNETKKITLKGYFIPSAHSNELRATISHQGMIIENTSISIDVRNSALTLETINGELPRVYIANTTDDFIDNILLSFESFDGAPIRYSKLDYPILRRLAPHASTTIEFPNSLQQNPSPITITAEGTLDLTGEKIIGVIMK